MGGSSFNNVSLVWGRPSTWDGALISKKLLRY